jgi:hypothetical protein
MHDIAHDKLAQQLRFSLAMSEDGFALKRQQLRRRNPQADEDEIERPFQAGLQDRPGAEHGDAECRPISWPPQRT